MLRRKLRNYELKIQTNLTSEHIIVANKKLEKLLNKTRSTATIFTYLYICLRVNKKADIGHLRNIRCKDIADDLGIPLSTIQDSINSLIKYDFIKRTFNKDRLSDYRVVAYYDILDDSYIKIPADLVFNDKFLKYSKDEVSGVLTSFRLAFLNTVASFKKLRSIKVFKDKQNYELIGQAESSRPLLKDTLLTKIKRVNSKDLDRVVCKIKELGLSVSNIVKKTKDNVSKVTGYVIGISQNTLSSLFRPFISKSHIRNNPLAFDTVDKILANTGLYKFFKDKEALEDMTQMYVEYGDLYFNAGVLSLQGVLHNNHQELVDVDGSKIENLCAYFRTSVESFIEKCKSKK